MALLLRGYDELCGKVLRQVVILLRDDKWSSTERWMLETLRDSEKAAPEWVTEQIKAKDENNDR